MNATVTGHQVKFILIRAGSTDFDVEGRILGALDLPINAAGEAEIRRTAEELSGWRLDAIYAAANLASRQSAMILAGNRSPRVRVLDKLTNLNCGLWHGKRLAELKETQPRVFRQWCEHPEEVHPPNGETVGEVRARVAAILKKLGRKHKCGLVAIVAPDPLLSIVRCEIEGKSCLEGEREVPKCGGWNLVEVLQAIV